MLQACLKALPRTQPGQRVNCVPGVTALSDKRRLVETLIGSYGSGAFTIIPRTFLLPQQYWDWRLWLLHQVFTRPAGLRRAAACAPVWMSCDAPFMLLGLLYAGSCTRRPMYVRALYPEHVRWDRALHSRSRSGSGC